MSSEVVSRTPDQTFALGQELARGLAPGDCVGLVGDLGAGKTLFVQGVAAGVGVPPEVRITSPTFTLINEYPGGRVPLYHADLYRIEREVELDELGLDDLIRRGDGVVLVEWYDRFPVLPPDHLVVQLTVAGENERHLGARASGPRSAELLSAWLPTGSEP